MMPCLFKMPILLGLTNAFSLHQHQLPSSSCQKQGTRLFEQATKDNPPITEKEHDSVTHKKGDTDAITALAGNIVQCLFKSDLKRKGGGDGGGSTGWTSWVDDKAAFRLRACVDSIAISKPINPSDASGLTRELLTERDITQSWLRWMKSTPSPVMVDLSDEVRHVADSLIHEKDLEMIETTKDDFLNRIGVNLILMPSGKSLDKNIRTPPGAMAYGKILYGGAKRYRILPGKLQRKTGERTALITKEGENVEAWLQYGGPERNYVAVDMGACCILEVVILPQGLKIDPSWGEGGHMTLQHVGWEAKQMLSFWEASNEEHEHDGSNHDDPLLNLSGKDRNDFMRDSFTQKVGGLQPQIDSIVRRVLDGRIYLSEDGEMLGSQSQMEAKELESLGLSAVRGLLLYGPPGCGKTALAREISNALRARKPKVVSAPELLDRWVGGSEKLIRGLFEEAEMELKACRGDTSKCSLHVIVIDEIDAVFRKRSASEDSGSVTRASAVNQILAKLDGVNAVPNVLLIGMTNRRELLDDALLRPGRLEVQIEIPIPNENGRRQILQIHFEALRRKGRLSKPLCRAIDGSDFISEPHENRRFPYLSRIKAALSPSNGRITDLAAESITGGFSGADCSGLVRCAGSIALDRARKEGMGGIESLVITLDDVAKAIIEVKE